MENPVSIKIHEAINPGRVRPHPLSDGYLGELLHQGETLSDVHEHGETVLLLVHAVDHDGFTKLDRLLLEKLEVYIIEREIGHL